MAVVGSTFRILTSKVGEGGQKRGYQVRRIQQLLMLAGEDVGKSKDDGIWGSKTRDALLRFKKKQQSSFSIDESAPNIGPDSLELFMLAYRAGVLIPLGAIGAGVRGIEAYLKTHQWLKDNDIPYGWGRLGVGGSRFVFGLHDYPNMAIVTTVGKPYLFDLAHPVALHCVSYANLLMSVWSRGDAHGAPYDAYQGNTGGGDRLAKRFMYPVMGLYKWNEIEKAVVDGKLYTMEKSKTSTGDGYGTHQTLLLNKTVYEANVTKIRETQIRDVPLDEYLEYSKPGVTHYILCGPSPN